MGETANPYFSSHYYLGHRKFETGEPEVFLFGDLQDLNYLPPKPVKVYRAENMWPSLMIN